MKNTFKYIFIGALFCLNFNQGCAKNSGNINPVENADVTPPTVTDNQIEFSNVSPTGFTLQWVAANDDVTEKNNLLYKSTPFKADYRQPSK